MMEPFAQYIEDLREVRVYRRNGDYWSFKISDPELGKRCEQFLLYALQEVIEDIVCP